MSAKQIVAALLAVVKNAQFTLNSQGAKQLAVIVDLAEKYLSDENKAEKEPKEETPSE